MFLSLSLSLKVRDLNPFFCFDLGEGEQVIPLNVFFLFSFFFFFLHFYFNFELKKKKTTYKTASFSGFNGNSNEALN